jgi:endoglucanase
MHFTHTLMAVGLAALALAGPTALTKRAKAPTFNGVNESGAEFGDNKFPGVYNTDYTWYTLSTYDTFIAQGFNTFRINFFMERLIPNNLTGTFDPGYVGNLTQQVNYITGKGAYAMICPHNYGRYYGNIITDTAGFQAFWTTLATQFKGNDHVIFDTNNEYNTMPGQLVANLNQAAINGIRGAGATSQWITAEGNSWTGAWTWTTSQGTDGLTNAQTMGSLTDPSNKLIYQVHRFPLAPCSLNPSSIRQPC